MPKLKQPPFIELPNSKNGDWSDSWHEFIRDLQPRINERPELVGSTTPGNITIIDNAGNLEDGGVSVPSLPDGTIADEEYVREYTGERFIIDNVLPEAGTEEGARFGSYRIGLLTENDYAYFDENGKLIFYGTSGTQIITPENATSTTRFAVFDSSGNLKYRTAEQLADDLDGLLVSRDYVSETFITENLLDEAALDDLIVTGIDSSGDVVIDSSIEGVVLKDSQSPPHYWRITVSVLGVLTTTDLGVIKP